MVPRLTLALDGVSWRSSDDFVDALLRALGAPEWHGRNLDALEDSIGGGGINRVEPPYHIAISGRWAMAPAAQEAVGDFCELVRDLKARGVQVEVSYE